MGRTYRFDQDGDDGEFGCARRPPTGANDGVVYHGNPENFVSSPPAVPAKESSPVQQMIAPAMHYQLLRPVLLAMLVPHVTYAQPGTLDPTFGGSGIVTTSITDTSDVGSDVAVQSDGKIIVAGTTNNGANNDFLAVRYNVDGSLDGMFGSLGTMIIDFGGTNDRANAIVIQPDGMIVLAGTSAGDFAVVRLTTDGGLDPTFGADGKVSTDIAGWSDAGNDLALQEDGKIVVCGGGQLSALYADLAFAAVRYSTDGSLGPKFSSDRIASTVFTASVPAFAWGIEIMTDGRIILGGVFAEQDFALVRYSSDGTLDNSFDGDGKVTTDIGTGHDVILDIALQPDGRVLAAGVTNSPDLGFSVARYNVDGSLDNSFSGDGIVITPVLDPFSDASSIAVLSSGKILVAGDAYNGSDRDLAMVRYDADGSIDLTFGIDGIVTADAGSEEQCNAMFIQQDEKIVLAGATGPWDAKDLVVARFFDEPNGVAHFLLDHEELSAYPNPANEATVLSFTLPASDLLGLRLYDACGRLVQVLFSDERRSPGLHTEIVSLDPDLPSGIYAFILSGTYRSMYARLVKQ